MKLNHLFALLFSIAIFILSCSEREADKKLITSDDREKLTYLKEVEWPKAYREQDTVLLDRILNDDFQMIRANGDWSTKKDEINWIKNNNPSYDSFRFEIKRLDIYENGTAVVSGTGHIVNDSVKTIYQSSNILIKKAGVWKAITSHVSGIRNIN